MDSPDVFIREFEKLLATISPGYTLEQWQYATKRVVYSMVMKIMNGFPEDVVGHYPSNARGGGDPGPGVASSPNKGRYPEQDGGPGPGAGGHPYIVCLLDGVLQLKPAKPKDKST